MQEGWWDALLLRPPPGDPPEWTERPRRDRDRHANSNSWMNLIELDRPFVFSAPIRYASRWGKYESYAEREFRFSRPFDWGQWFLIARQSTSSAASAAALYILYDTFSYLEMVESKQSNKHGQERDQQKVKRKERKWRGEEGSFLSYRGDEWAHKMKKI